MKTKYENNDENGSVIVLLQWRDECYIGKIRSFMKNDETLVLVSTISIKKEEFEKSVGLFPIIRISNDIVFRIGHEEAMHLMRIKGGIISRLSVIDTEIFQNVINKSNMICDIQPKFEIITT